MGIQRVICANCSSPQGPFITSWSHYNIPICKNTKSNQDRITECVARREKSDYIKYKNSIT